MKILAAFCLFQGFLAVHAASGCKKDACYNNVAVQRANGPGLNQRRADCSALLKQVVDDDKSVTTSLTITPTVTSSTQIITTTTTLSTITILKGTTTTSSVVTITTTSVIVTSTQTISQSATTLKSVAGLKFRDIQAAAVANDFAQLDVRDKYVLQGDKPSYATACLNRQAYATACLCYGIKPQQQFASTTVSIISTKTATSSVTSQSTSMVSSTITEEQTTTSTVSATSSTTVTKTSTAQAQTTKTVGFGLRREDNNKLLVKTYVFLRYAGSPGVGVVDTLVDFVLKANGRIAPTSDLDNELAVYVPQPDQGFVIFSKDQALSNTYPMTCLVDDSNRLQCTAGPATDATQPEYAVFDTFAACTSNTDKVWVFSNAAAQLFVSRGSCTIIQLKAGVSPVV